MVGGLALSGFAQTSGGTNQGTAGQNGTEQGPEQGPKMRHSRRGGFGGDFANLNLTDAQKQQLQTQRQ